MHAVRILLPILFLAGAVSGCITAGRCRLQVTNKSDVSLRTFVVTDTNGNTYAFTNIVRPSVASDLRVANIPLLAVMGKGIQVHISRADGTNVTRIVNLYPPAMPNYPGCLTLEVDEDSALVRTFFWKDPGAGQGDMPWAEAPPWQGALSVPGMPGSPPH